MPATLNEAPQIYKAEFSDAHSTKAVALAFACRCNFIHLESKAREQGFNAASSIRSLQQIAVHCKVSGKQVSMPQAALGRCNCTPCGPPWILDQNETFGVKPQNPPQIG